MTRRDPGNRAVIAALSSIGGALAAALIVSKLLRWVGLISTPGAVIAVYVSFAAAGVVLAVLSGIEIRTKRRKTTDS
jgi:hypothetical protein